MNERETVDPDCLQEQGTDQAKRIEALCLRLTFWGRLWTWFGFRL